MKNRMSRAWNRLKRAWKRKDNRRGFTVSELLVVAAVVGVVAGMPFAVTSHSVSGALDAAAHAANARAEWLAGADAGTGAGVAADADAPDASTTNATLEAASTGFAPHGVQILVWPAGGGKVTCSEGKYSAVPNPGYVFMSWYRSESFSAQEVGGVLAERRSASEAYIAALSRDVGDDSIERYADAEGVKYLVALFDKIDADSDDGDDVDPATVATPSNVNVCAHNWGPTQYKWTAYHKSCTAVSKCQKCGREDKVKAKEVVVSKVRATCTKDGSIKYEARFKKSKLNTQATEDIPALGHDWGEWKADEAAGVERRACGRCGATETRPLSAPTPEEDTPPHTHTPKAAVKENEVAATCQQAGSYDSVVYCDGCGEELSREQKTVDKLDHTPKAAVKENEVAATCTTMGSYESVVYCDACGEEISREKKTTDKLEHQYKQTDDAWEEGDKWGYIWECSVCHDRIKVPVEEVIDEEVVDGND